MHEKFSLPQKKIYGTFTSYYYHVALNSSNLQPQPLFMHIKNEFLQIHLPIAKAGGNISLSPC